VCYIDRKESGEREGEIGKYMKSETQLEILCLSGAIIVFF
jgi:hypothetical protein